MAFYELAANDATEEAAETFDKGRRRPSCLSAEEEQETLKKTTSVRMGKSIDRAPVGSFKSRGALTSRGGKSVICEQLLNLQVKSIMSVKNTN